MDYTLIATPLEEKVYQGGTPDDEITTLDGAGRRLLLVEMAAGIDAIHWVRQGDLAAALYFGIDDTPDGCLPDDALLSLAGIGRAWLQQRNHIFFGCAAGVSRSSYANCATLMATLFLTYDQALALIRASRPQASPNVGFEAQLRRLEQRLMSL